MRLADATICIVCVVLAGAMLTGAGLQLDSINAHRKEMKLIVNEPLENAPPSLAFATVAMGAFRGLVVDVLWMRADKLKEEGQFFDARQLAEWITALQPRFAAVWEFHAWNMAYNISVAIPASQPEQRWRWVKNGYELLRDKGIPLNPKAINLYRELGRIFQHKIGDVSDDAHKYYKLQLALAIEPLLGSADNKYFDELVAAPKQWAEIVADPNIEQLVGRLKASDSGFAKSDPDEFINNYLSLRQNAGRFVPAAGQVIDDFRGSKALDRFDVFAKAYELRNGWKLEPELMRELNNTYGPTETADPNVHVPLDWRHPDSHALYWAVKGLKVVAQDQGREIEAAETNADRMVAHALQNLFRNGKLFIYTAPVEVPSEDPSQPPQVRMLKEVFLRPDLRMFDAYNKSALAIIEKYKESDRSGRQESLQNGHRNMLINALLMFYQSGHQEQAQRIYSELRRLYPRPDFDVPLLEFARARMLEELDRIGIHDAKEQTIGLLREAYYLFAIHDDDSAFGRESLAKEIYDHYNSIYNEGERIDLPSFNVLRYLSLIDFLNDERHPIYFRQNLLSRIKAERPDLYKQLEAEEDKLQNESERQDQTG
jgi:hypothetical protein